ncbi:hypothetical protein JHK84_037118 [Glycine max]|nr:hypothetical protein JHK84_037118 [Glycine max]
MFYHSCAGVFRTSDTEIKGCQNLESLPGQGFPNSLASLSISDCRLPVPLCQRDTGAYWDLIPGLQRLEIDGEDISLETEEQ